MMTPTKTIHIITIACVISMAFGPAISHSKKPSFYHYYYVYPNSMTWCGKLVNEVFKNTNKNWRFTRKKVTETTAAFSVGNERGFLRCLAKKSNESWVVIIASGNDAGKTKDLFEELRVGVCGKCSDWVD